MIDHVTLVVKDYKKSKAFYLAALQPLGYALVMELTRENTPGLPIEATCGLGVGGKPDLWIRAGNDSTPIHLAIRANDNAAVDAFYKAALAAGGTDNGAAGPRAHYHPHYYGAFVLDPNGHNLEAVCHGALLK